MALRSRNPRGVNGSAAAVVGSIIPLSLLGSVLRFDRVAFRPAGARWRRGLTG
jgi:hypothetical protein